MFVYCGNNPVNFTDEAGERYVPVGGGVQFEASFENTVVGVELIIFWDVDECQNGAPVVAMYIYDGVSVNVSDALQASILSYVADNTNVFEDGSVDPYVLIDGLVTMLQQDFSISASGFLVFGNEDFSSTLSYCKEFTSVGGSAGNWKGSVAYSSSCFTVSVGKNLVGGNCLPSWGVSKTWYERIAIWGDAA